MDILNVLWNFLNNFEHGWIVLVISLILSFTLYMYTTTNNRIAALLSGLLANSLLGYGYEFLIPIALVLLILTYNR
ncbi:MAG: hypothetical protein QXM92_02725 [Candidatus Anstonellales archaeon]